MSIVRSGTFCLKRRISANTNNSVPIVGQPCVKRFRLLEHRKAIAPEIDLNTPYIDIGETSPSGVGIFTINIRGVEERKTLPRAYEIKVSPSDTRITNYYLGDRMDLTQYKLGIRIPGYNCKSLSNDVVFWDDDITDVERKSYFIGRRAHTRWLKRMVSDRLDGEIRRRVLRTEVVSGSAELRSFFEQFNCQMATHVSRISPILEGFTSLAKYKVENVGQVILAMLIEGGHLSGNRPSFKLKLMFLFIEELVMRDGTRFQFLIAQLYAWLVLRVCDSCFEKILLDGGSPTAYRGQYDYTPASFDTAEGRYMIVAPSSGLDYEIKMHGQDVSDSLSWKMWEHSFIRPRFTHGQIIFQILTVNGDRLDVPVCQHWGMSLISCMEGLHKGLISAIFGRGNAGMVRWANANRLVIGNDNTNLCMLLIDLVHLYAIRSPLSILIENVFFYLIVASAPKSLVDKGKTRLDEQSNGHSVDFFDVMVRHCFGTSSEIHSQVINDVLSYMSPEQKMLRLKSEDIQLTMTHYITDGVE